MSLQGFKKKNLEMSIDNGFVCLQISYVFSVPVKVGNLEPLLVDASTTCLVQPHSTLPCDHLPLYWPLASPNSLNYGHSMINPKSINITQNHTYKLKDPFRLLLKETSLRHLSA